VRLTWLKRKDLATQAASAGRLSSGELFWSGETLRSFQCGARTKPTLESVISRVHPEDCDLVQQQIDRVSRDGEGSFDFEYRLQLSDRSSDMSV
jgi:PAS fold